MSAAQPEASDYQAAHEGLRRTQARTRGRLRRLARAVKAYRYAPWAERMAAITELDDALIEAEKEVGP